MTHYLAIQLPPDDVFSLYDVALPAELHGILEHPTHVLGPLAGVSLFVGQNNSGKSRFLRRLFSHSDRKGVPAGIDPATIVNLLQMLTNGGRDQVKDLWPTRLQRVYDAMYGTGQPTAEWQSWLDGLGYHDWDRLAFLTFAAASALPDQLHGYNAKNAADVKGNFQGRADSTTLTTQKHTYVPVLRGLRAFDPEATDLYRAKTKTDYFSDNKLNEPKDGWSITTGLALYQRLKRMLLGKPEGREAVRAFEAFLSKWFFAGELVTLIPVEPVSGEVPSSTIELIVGKGIQRPLHDWGDGLQGLVVCLFDAFTSNEPARFYIEEPDTHLHPAYQRAMLEAMVRDLTRHQFYLTTHSNHFLDMAADYGSDVSIFQFQRTGTPPEERFLITHRRPTERETLVDIGVRHSSTLLTNATIWVEGVTDRKYLRAYMARYIQELAQSPEGSDDWRLAEKCKKLREDRHYSFVEYSGANLVHWTFESTDESREQIKAAFLCAHAIVVMDGDATAKRNRGENYRAMLDDRLIVVPGKEIENLIPIDVLQSIVRDWVKKPDLQLKGKNGLPPKGPLGRFLDKALTGSRQFTSSSGAIKSDDKPILCDKVVVELEGLPDDWRLPEPVREICCQIFGHIVRENHI